MSPDIRVKTSAKYGGIYKDLRNLAVGDAHELFFLCACLGYKQKIIKPIEKKEREDRFWSRTIDPEEWTCYYSIVLKENEMDYSIIQDDVQVLEQVEKYANGGMEILLDEVLSDYLIPNKKNNTPKLDMSFAKELPKVILSYIREQL
jgi:hypothetical protein